MSKLFQLTLHFDSWCNVPSSDTKYWVVAPSFDSAVTFVRTKFRMDRLLHAFAVATFQLHLMSNP